LQYIMESNPEKAKQLYRTLKRIKDFEKFLISQGYKINETGFFTLDEPIPGLDWSVPLSFLIEGLKVGEISPPIKIKNYYLLIRLKQKRHPHLPRFEEIKENIKEIYLKEEAQKMAKDILKPILFEIKKMQENNLKIDFSEFARKYNLKYGTTELFKRSTYISQIGASDKFFINFGELKEGNIGDDIVEMEQAFFITKIKEYKPVDEEVFKKEKEEFSKNLLLKIKDIRFLEYLSQLRQKAELKILF
ncbi:MAG: peptidylprolyl isomerase, partial [Candidatus Omnitrophica bacterium]|nr:peptidylprolyl isomerase [Candidatus Omnitrophota bacterium]